MVTTGGGVAPAVGGLVDVEAHDDLAVGVAQLGLAHQPSALVDDEQGADAGRWGGSGRAARPDAPGRISQVHRPLLTELDLASAVLGGGDWVEPAPVRKSCWYGQ